MNLLKRSRKWLLAGLLVFVVTTGMVTIRAINSDSMQHAESGTANQRTKENTNQSTFPQTASSEISPVDSAHHVVSVPKPAAPLNAELPPIPAKMAAEIRHLSNHTTDGLIEEKQSDGSVSMDLQGHFQSVTAAVRGPDGKIIVRHGEEFLANVEPVTNTPGISKTNPAR